MNLNLFDSPEFQEPEPSNDNIVKVYEHWKSVLVFPNRRLTPARRRVLNARLKHYSVDQLCQVINYVAKDPWWRGNNPRKTPYDDLVNIFRNDERVDMFLSKGNPENLGPSDKPIDAEEF